MFNIYKLHPRNVYLSMDVNSQAPEGRPRTFTVNMITCTHARARARARAHTHTHTHTHTHFSNNKMNRQEAQKIKLLSHEQLKREKSQI